MDDKKLPLVEINDPILNALDALEEGDFHKFQQALKVGVNFSLRGGNPMRIFEKALGTPGRAKYVKECLYRGCKPNYINTDLKKAAINFAIDSHDPEILTELLCHSNEKIDVDHKYQKLTPLNSLAKNLTAKNATDVVACMKLLLSHNASANIPDQDKRAPLEHALNHYSELDENIKYEILRLFVDNVKDDIIYNNFEVCSILEKDYPELVLIRISRYQENYLSNPNRTNAVQHALFNNIELKNLKAFRDILINAADPLYLLSYTQEDFNPFEKALQTCGCAEIVATCLKYGCKTDYINEDRNETAMNYAVKSCDPKIIDLLLSESNIPVNHKGSSHFSPDNSPQLVTPLYSLAEHLCFNDPALSDNIKACMELLLKYGASPDVPNKHGMTPLLFVLKMRELDKETKHGFVKLLLDYDAHTDIYRGDEILHILQRDYPDLEPPITSDEIEYETLLEHLRSGNELRFVHLFQRFKVNFTKLQAVQKGELFLSAIDLRRYSAFNELLQSDQPLKHTVSEDSSELFSNLLFSCIINIGLGTEASSTFQCLKKCFLMLLKSKRIDVNTSASVSMVPLKIALEFSNDFVIKELLKHGAYIGRLDSDVFNNFPIEMLEEHFNNCITSNGADWNDINFQIFINYKNLLTNEPQPGDSNKIQHQKPEDNINVRIPMDSKNLFTTEDRIKTEAGDKDMTAIALIANSSKHRHLLQHPLITSYLFVKWHRYSRLFYFNFFFYLLFTISFITHITLTFCESEHQAVTALFGVISRIGIVYLAVREIAQIIMATKIFVHSKASWIELFLVIFLIMTYVVQDPNIQRSISAIAIMLIALDLCLLVGSLPNLFISTHMMILRAVCSSTLKILSLFSIFIWMFSVCFYLAFSEPMTNENTSDTINNNASETMNNNASDTNVQEVEFSDFPNLLDSIIKTVAMLTGAYETTGFTFNTGFSYVIFVVFVILMPMVLLNLLNGLAVYDTQAIKIQAELNASIYLANLLIDYETVLTEQSRFITFLKKYDRIRAMYYRLLNICLNNTTTDKIAILPNNRNKFKTTIKKNPMLAGILYVPLNNETCLEKLLRITFKCSEMDGRTVKSAMAIIKQKAQTDLRRQEMNERKRSDELQQQEKKKKENKFESELQTVKETLSEVLTILQDIKGVIIKETETNEDKIEGELQI